VTPTRSDAVIVAVGLAVAVVAISSSAILVREALATGIVIALWRNIIGSAVLAPFAWRAVRSDVAVRSALRANARLLVASGVVLGLHFALWLEGLQKTSVAGSVTLVTMSPVFVAAGSVLVLKEPLRRIAVPGILIAIIGGVIVGWVGVVTNEVATNPTLGNLMSFGGAAAIAVYILLGRRARTTGVPTPLYGAIVYLVAAAVLLPAAVWSGAAIVDLSLRTWLVILAMVAGPQLLGHTLLNFVLARTSPTIVSVTTLLEPIGSVMLAWWLLSETPNSGFWWGTPLVLAGLSLTVLSTRPLQPAA
jgi:drug/metabolite transporter (DMT)-like permease